MFGVEVDASRSISRADKIWIMGGVNEISSCRKVDGIVAKWIVRAWGHDGGMVCVAICMCFCKNAFGDIPSGLIAFLCDVHVSCWGRMVDPANTNREDK